MSLANKMAKIGTLTPLPNGGAPDAYEIGGRRFLGPPGYMGDARYMGDPGIFGSIFKGLKSVVGIASGIAGAAGVPGASAFSRFIGGGRRTIPGASTAPIYQLPAPLPRAPIAMPGSGRPTFVGLQAGRTRLGLTTAAAAPMIGPAPPPSATMGGYHLNKSSYFLMDGTFIAAGTKWVKNRRRNPGNMRALSRSLGRIKSAKKMATVLGTISIRSSCPTPRRKSKK